MTGPRAAAEAYLLPDQGEIVRPGQAVSNGRGGVNPGPETRSPVRCNVVAVSGAEAAEPLLSVRGAYRVSVPVATDIREGDTVEALGRRYQVVWAPAAGGLDLLRTAGAKELR